MDERHIIRETKIQDMFTFDGWNNIYSIKSLFTWSKSDTIRLSSCNGISERRQIFHIREVEAA